MVEACGILYSDSDLPRGGPSISDSSGALETESTVFRDMFLLPQDDSETIEGQSDTSPVILQGVSKMNLKPTYFPWCTRQHGAKKGSGLDQAQWVSVLRLSTMWEFDELRNVAIQHLDQPSPSFNAADTPPPFNPVDKFALASKYEIKEWYLPALLTLARRSKPISIEEGHRIGFENALKVAAVREELKMMRVMNSIPRNYTLKPSHERSIQSSADKEEANRNFASITREAFSDLW
ncbi:hypothetical protein EDC04DRAFT_3140241 [Pisolithus marmoratus]|nr:hypothetical protein EDC04DRAFT_3140241 [Pisolithus marmoratus]